MSWQRILRFAKIRQVPVIITDETGEDPMILLSLDQLEQALDGGVGPDIPPPPPAPRPTTPSFAPEEVMMPDAEPVPESVDAAEPVSEVPATDVALESINVMTPLNVDASTASGEGPAQRETSFRDAEPPANLEPVLEPEIVTPPAMTPEQPALEVTPLDASPRSAPAEPAQVEPTSVSVEAAKPTPAPASDMSLEERFFLEY